MNPRITIKQGVLHVDGNPTFVWSADYPYYRDQRSDWPGQLDNLKKMNVNVVTFYIPWRHHAPTDPLHTGGKYDFRGELHDRTDVLEFIRLIRERGMFCIAKPGPYIHAETRFGSLPDYVLPNNNPKIALRVDMQGDASPACWGFPNPPAPMDPVYLDYVRDWFEHVAREVISPNEYPNGPILAVQVLNEGIYSDGGYGVDKIHFDAPAIEHYRAFLSTRYNSIENYNRCCHASFSSFADVPPPRQWAPREKAGELLPWLDWAEFGQHFYRVIADTYIAYLRNAGITLPMVMNINPPPSPRGAAVETVMGRYTPPFLTPVISYGYTNWCGVVSHNEDAWLKYKIVGKSARGINMEENWGFDSYDPPYYWSVQPSFFQSMAYMLWGATGLNIYLGVSCDCWTDYLAVDAGGVYMHNHPIAEDGSYRDSFWTCHQMGALMKRVGNDLVRDDLPAPVAWGLYSPYAHAASWDSAPQDWTRVGFPGRPHAAWCGWDSFMALCDSNKTQNAVCYPREESVDQLLRHRVLFMEGNGWMDAATQKRLVEYVEKGGVLVLNSCVPMFDEFFRPCTILRDKLFPFSIKQNPDDAAFEYSFADGMFNGTGRGVHCDLSGFSSGVLPLLQVRRHEEVSARGAIKVVGAGKAVFIGFSPWQTECGEWGSVGLIEHIARRYAGVSTTATVVPDPIDPLVEVAEFPCAAKRRRYFYLLTRKDKPASYEICISDADRFSIQLPSFSGAFVGLNAGRIVAALIKGYNDLDKSAAQPRLAFKDKMLAASDPCDLYFCRMDDGSCEVSVTNVQNPERKTIVTLPIPSGSVKRIVRIMSDGTKEPVANDEREGRAAFVAEDMRTGTNGCWSSCYRIYS